MRKILFLLVSFLLGLLGCKDDSNNSNGTPVEDKVLAFPQAEGAGAYAVGGRAGTVWYVTNLDDDGPGSLRYALMNSGPKATILFAVSGTIQLNSALTITNNNITIAGQSAPGDGITIANSTMNVSKVSDVIIRFVRFRMGDLKASEADALEGQNSHYIMIDHCSMSWSIDECSSFYDNANMTMQWCILSESLRNSKHYKGNHGYGGMWGGRTVSYHHNLFAHHDSRNPRFCGARFSNKPNEEKIDFRNNVIYNWGGNSGYGGEGGVYNIINNYYKPGPATDGRGVSSGTSGEVRKRIFAPDSDTRNGDKSTNLPKGTWGNFYVEGNYMGGSYSSANATGNYSDGSDVTNDNWKGIHKIIDANSPAPVSDIRLYSPVDMPSIRTQTAQEAYGSVLDFAGASFVRDAVDNRIIDNVKNRDFTAQGSRESKYGIIDSQEDVGGFPVLNGGVVITRNLDEYDTDRDGIPNEWELAKGLDPNNANDGKAKTLDPQGQYTNLEIYLNSLVEHCYPAGY